MYCKKESQLDRAKFLRHGDEQIPFDRHHVCVLFSNDMDVRPDKTDLIFVKMSHLRSFSDWKSNQETLVDLEDSQTLCELPLRSNPFRALKHVHL